MIGARGRDEVHDFYANHFLSQIPPVPVFDGTEYRKL
jgi:hypothetical protein